MKKSNLEKAIIMGVILSTGLYGNALAQELGSSIGNVIINGTEKDPVIDTAKSDVIIWGEGIVGAQAAQDMLHYDYTLNGNGKITINKNASYTSGSYSYNDGISIKGGQASNFKFTINAGDLDIGENQEFISKNKSAAGIGLNNGFTPSSNNRYIDANINLTKKDSASNDGILNIRDYDKGLNLGANTRLNIIAEAVNLTGNKENLNKTESVGIEQGGKRKEADSNNTDSVVNITAKSGDINIKDYVNGISITGTGNTTNLTTNQGSINFIGIGRNEENPTTIKSQNAINMDLGSLSSTVANNKVSLTVADSINIKGYITGVNVYGEGNTTGENGVYIEAANGFSMNDVGTGILAQGQNSKVSINARTNIISANDKLDVEGGSPSGKAIMASIKSNVSLSGGSNIVTGTVSAIDNKGATVNINANGGRNTLSSSNRNSIAISADGGITYIKSSENIISGGSGLNGDGYYYDGTAISATLRNSDGAQEASKVDILASDYNKIHGIVKSEGTGTKINIGGSLSGDTLNGSKYNMLASQGVISDGSNSVVSSVYAKDSSEINLIAGSGDEQYNLITTNLDDNKTATEKTVWAKDATVNIAGYQNHISAGGKFIPTDDPQNPKFEDHYSGTALEATSSSSNSKIDVSANGQNIIGGAVVASGANASIDITNTGNSATRADSFIGNNITSAKNDNGSITAISATNQAKVNIKADSAVNYIKAFSNNVDNNKSAKKVAISANDSTVNVSGLQNIIVAGDNREGMIVDATNDSKTTVTISSSLGSNLSGGLKAVGENNTIKIEGLSNAGNGTNQIISSSEVDTGVISAIYVKDKAQININDAKNSNFIATVSSDGQKSQKTVVVDNTTTKILGKNNTIAAGLTEKESKGISNFEDTYKGVALDVNNKGKLDILVGAKDGVNAISGSVNIKDSTLNMNCTPKVGHKTTFGGAVFL